MSNNDNKAASKGYIANPKVQLLLFIITIVYAVSPIDFIPDVMPIIGYLDDFGVILNYVVCFLLFLKKKRAELNNGNADK